VFADEPASAGKAPVAATLVTSGAPPARPFASVSGLKAEMARLKAKIAARREAIEKKNGKSAAEGDKGQKEVGLGYIESLLWRVQLRAFPRDTVDAEAYRRAAQHRLRMPGSQIGASKAPTSPRAGGDISAARVDIGKSLGKWEYVGPRAATPPRQQFFGPVDSFISGRVNGITFDPNTQGTAYLAAAGGGVWKTTDGGVNWTALGDRLNYLHTNAIAVKKTSTASPTPAVYLGMGDFNGRIGGLGIGFPTGVYRSVDGGATWALRGTEFAGTAVSAIEVDPDAPNIVTATTGRGSQASGGGIWRSTNAGDTWSRATAIQGDWNDLELGVPDPVTRKRFYYATHLNDGLYRSDDQGATWNKLNVPLIYNGKPVGGFLVGLELAVSRLDSKTVYVVDAGTDAGDGKMFKSTDAGATWLEITGTYPTVAGDTWPQAWYDLHLTAGQGVNRDGLPEDVLYVGTLALAGSVGGSFDWTNLSLTSTGERNFGLDRIHTDQQCMAVDPFDPNHMLVGNDGGVYGMTFDPGTGVWNFDITLNRTLGVMQFYKADWHPTDPKKMLGGTQDNATPHSQGNLNQWVNIGFGDGAGCAINPKTPAIQYASAQGQFLFRTLDEWKTLAFIRPDFGTDRLPFIGTIALDPTQPNYLYAATNYLWRYDENNPDLDPTRRWTARVGGTELAPDGGVLISIAVAPSNSNVVYVGSDRGHLWVTFNAFAATPVWKRLDSAPLPVRAIMSLSVNPFNFADVIIGLSGTGSGHLWRCANSRASAWTFTNQSGSGVSALPDIPLNAVTRDANDPVLTFYAATDIGVFTTINGGQNWTDATRGTAIDPKTGLPVDLGLPFVDCEDIKYVADTGYLNVATFGRGMWRFNVSAVAGNPDLRITPTLRRVNGEIRVTLTIVNQGGPARNVQITGGSLKLLLRTGAAVPTTTTVPISAGNIAEGGRVNVTLAFPGSVGTPGSAATLSVTGTHNAGTFGLNNFRTRLP